MTSNDFLEKLKQNPESVEFNELMELIEKEYEFQPTAFKNGDVENAENENSGSCKVFSFAQMHKLTANHTLACFGTYYRDDVLNNPTGDDHGNIRNFIEYGWSGIAFAGEALRLK